MQELIQDFLACAQREKGWEPALDRFVDEFDLFSAVMFTIHDFGSMRSGFYWSDNIKNGLLESTRQRIMAGEDTQDHEAYARVLQLPALVPHDELTLMGVERADQLPPSDIRDWCDSIGIKMRIPTVLNRSGPWVDGFFAHTKGENDHKSFVTDPKVRMILPIISGAVTLGRVLSTLRNRYNAALTALDKLGLGVFILDTVGRVVDSNREAQAILDQKDGLNLSPDGRIRLSDAHAQAELQHILDVQSNLLDHGADTKMNMCACPRPSRRFDFLISARPIKDVDGELENQFSGIFLTVIDPARQNVLSADGLTALASLTDAESQITQMMVDGLKIMDISERREVSVETVRSQVKALMQKLRCNSQSDIIRVAASTRLPFDDEKDRP